MYKCFMAKLFLSLSLGILHENGRICSVDKYVLPLLDPLIGGANMQIVAKISIGVTLKLTGTRF